MASRRALAFTLACLVGTITFASACDDDTSATSPPPVTSDGGVFDASAPDSGGGSDAAPDAAPARCAQASPFGAPARVVELGSPNLDFSVGLSEGDLVATFVSNRLRDAGGFYDVLTAKRASASAPFGTPTVVAELATDSNAAVTVSADGRTMVLERGSPSRLYLAERATTSVPWATPQPWSGSADGDTMPFLVHDASAIYFVRQGAIHRAARTGPGAYGAASPVAFATAPGEPIRPAVTADELTLYLGDRPLVGTPFDVFVARRASISDVWGAPVRVDELASSVADWPSWISADGCEIFISSNRTQNDAGTPDHEFWTATRGN